MLERADKWRLGERDACQWGELGLLRCLDAIYSLLERILSVLSNFAVIPLLDSPSSMPTKPEACKVGRDHPLWKAVS
jgi:hypothetical protein